jgi:hypothetical protein
MDLIKMKWDVVKWIHLDQDSVQWRALVNTAMDIEVSQNAVNFTILETPLCFMEIISSINVAPDTFRLVQVSCSVI